MSLPSTQNWTVVSFREGKTQDNPNGPGQLTAFYVDFIGEDDAEVGGVYWRRKTGNTPEVNKPVFGTVSEGNYGPMFKLEQQGGGGFSGPKPTHREGAHHNPDAERQRRIERQHSQEMALRLIDASRDAGDLDLTDQVMVTTYLNEVVKRLTDWFVHDLEKR